MIGKINTKGFTINGIIEQYTAGSNSISAGDLVSHLNGFDLASDTQLTNASYSAMTISAVALSANKVFIAHGYNTSTETSVSQWSLYGMVCTISGATISHGADTQITTDSYAGKKISTVALSSSKVFIAHSYGNYLRAYVIVCTINGTTISYGTSTQVGTAMYAADYAMQVVKLNSNKVFVALDNNSSNIYGIVCTVDGTAITAGTLTKLTTLSYTFEYFDAVTISENKVFIVGVTIHLMRMV